MTDSDYSLVEAIARGDHQAFERLVNRYRNPMFNFVLRLLGDRYAAEDVTQEVFLRVYRAAPRFEAKSRVSSWIFKIAYNLSINEIKRRSRFSSLSDDAMVIMERSADPASPSDEAMARRDLEEEFMETLNELSEAQRAALLLRVQEELSYREIAEVLDVSVQSVESLLFRARRKLKHILRKDRTGATNREERRRCGVVAGRWDEGKNRE